MNRKRKQVRGVGLLGAGRVARDHAYAVLSNPTLHLIGVADPDAERSARFAQMHGCTAYSNHHALLARDDIDLILVGVPHWLHAELVIDALNAGKHVLVEKPMAMTLDQCDTMIEAADKNNVRLMVGHTQHFFVANQITKGLIDSGQVGELIMATQIWYKPFGLADRPPWMLDRAFGGGMWWMNGAHMLDLLLWWVGSEVVAVKGSVTHKIMGQKAPDSIIALLEFANGVYANVAHSGFKRPSHHGPPEQWLTSEITGSEGMIKTLPYERQVWLNAEGEYEPLPAERDTAQVSDIGAFLQHVQPDAHIARSTIEEIAGVADEVSAFVQAIETGDDLPITHAHARAVVEALLAVEESSNTGREVRLR